MTYIIVGTVLSIWFALLGASYVLNKRAHNYIHKALFLLLFSLGLGANRISTHIGYEILVFGHGFELYIFLFNKNWALSIFVIVSALISYELSKLCALYYRRKHPAPRKTLAEELNKDTVPRSFW